MFGLYSMARFAPSCSAFGLLAVPIVTESALREKALRFAPRLNRFSQRLTGGYA